MPIPIPTKAEDKNDFIARCMTDETMNKEFPDSKQRIAICQHQWIDRKS